MTRQNRISMPLPRELLADRVAIVTGGSRGIGRATVLRLAEAGAKVVINYMRDERAAEKLVAEVSDKGGEALALRSNVVNSHELEGVVQQTIQRFGGCDILVANAGIWEGAPVAEMTDELWDRVLDTNLKGTWAACRAVVPVMKSQGRGAIVVVSSTAGQRGEANYSGYAASKGGQISFTKSLSTELAPTIRVNCVAPGWVDTELNTGVFQDNTYKTKIIGGIPLERLATPDDVALSVAFLASDWSYHITGEVLNVNGGAVLCG